MNQHCITVSVGLNVGDHEPLGQLGRTLSALDLVGPVFNVAVGHSEWDGVPERFVQAELLAGVSERGLRDLARSLQQTCISRLYPGVPNWTLHYADGHVELGGTVAEYPVILRAAVAYAA